KRFQSEPGGNWSRPWHRERGWHCRTECPREDAVAMLLRAIAHRQIPCARRVRGLRHRIALAQSLTCQYEHLRGRKGKGARAKQFQPAPIFVEIRRGQGCPGTPT